MAHQLVDVLRGIYGLENASEQGLIALGAASSYLVWEKDSVVFSAGDPADGVFVVVEGSVEVTDEDGEAVAILEEGQLFGEISMMFGTAHTKSARAVERSELLFVPKAPFDAYLAKHPDQATRLRELIETRLAEQQ